MSTPTPKRTRDADRTKRDILAVAGREFAEKGFDGARIDEIAAKTATTKRMLYYYFGDKDALYSAVLEDAYRRIRANEARVDVDHLDPIAALRAVAEATFDHNESAPDFVRLVSAENLRRGRSLATIEGIADSQRPAIELLDRILERGRGTGEFRADVSAVDLHMLISAFCTFRVAHRDSFRILFDVDLLAGAEREHLRRMAGDVAVRYARAD